MDLLSASWWFGTIPLYNSTTLRTFFVLFLSLIILGALVRMVSKRRLKDRYQLEVTKRSASLLVVMGILGLWYWFVANQQIPFLSARFWLPVLVILALWWAYKIVHYAVKEVPELRAKKMETVEAKTYMQPKRKK